MWPRISEIILAFWLLLSRFIFHYPDGHSLLGLSDIICAFAILFFSVLSFHSKWNKMHLCNLFVALWLILLAFLHPTPFLPPYLQSHLVVAIILLNFVTLPSPSNLPPRAWQTYLQEEEQPKE